MIFYNNTINLSKQKDKKNFLIKLGDAIYSLSHSKVCEGTLGIGGEYHKNYYKYIASGFFNGKNRVLLMKNNIQSEFIYNIKQNLCNFGIYFFKENKSLLLKIYSGNSFVIDLNIRNYIQKFCSSNFKINKTPPKFFMCQDYYFNLLKNYDRFNFRIKSKNSRVRKILNKFNLSERKSCNKVVINKDLTYEVYINKNKVNLNNFLKIKIYSYTTEEEMINKINLEKLKFVASKKNLLYNEIINDFDIFLSLNYLSKSLR